MCSLRKRSSYIHSYCSYNVLQFTCHCLPHQDVFWHIQTNLFESSRNELSLFTRGLSECSSQTACNNFAERNCKAVHIRLPALENSLIGVLKLVDLQMRSSKNAYINQGQLQLCKISGITNETVFFH